MNIVQTFPAMSGGRRRANVVAQQQFVPPPVEPAALAVEEAPAPAKRQKLTVKKKA